jgi:streptogramin lyase
LTGGIRTEKLPARMPLRRLIIPLALALSLHFAASAQAYVYWADPAAGTIGRANLDGTSVSDAFIHTGGEPRAVAVDGSHVYWANYAGGTIGRADLDGSGIEPSFITGAGHPNGVATTASYIFWTNPTGEEIGRAALTGGEKKPELIKSVLAPCGIAVDSGSVYWSSISVSEGIVGRAPFTGAVPRYEFVKETGAATMCGLAVNSANIFWANTGFLSNNGTQIGRANASDGKSPNPSLIGEALGPCGVATFGTQLYWANSGNGTIGRANTDGTGVVPKLVETGGGEICGVAVDSLSSPVITPPSGEGGGSSSPPPSSPSQPSPPTPGTISAGKLTPNLRRGTAQLKVVVDEAGVVSLTGKGIAPVTVTATGGGPVTLKLRAAKGKTATLKRTGKLATKVTVVFKPSNGGTSASLGRSLTLVKKLVVKVDRQLD